ncbi:hypothetical protein D3C76_1077350 [compost metagenome]
MTNSIGARQIHWHLHVCAMADLEALLSSIEADNGAELNGQCRRALFGGIQSATNLIAQEGWSPAMAAYPTTVKKLEHLQEYWFNHHQIKPDDPTFSFHSLEQMLSATAKVKYLTELLQIHIRFTTE